MKILILSSQAEPNQESFQLIAKQSWKFIHAYSRNAGAYKIASEIRKFGHAVEVADFITYWPEENFKKFLDDRVPHVDILAWSSQFFFDFKFYDKWVAYIKELNPNIIFVAGGPKVENLLNFTASKYLVAGYAENAIKDVLDHAEKKPNNLKFKIVNGKYYVDCNEYYKMEELPDMNTEYHTSDYVIPSEALTLSLSRGCVFKCSFCTYPYIGKKKGSFNRSGAEDYYAELMHNYEEYGTTHYYISDETVNDSVDKLLDLEEAANKLPFKLDFTGFMRLDLLTRQKQYWDMYKNIGFTNWHFGIESFNPHALKVMSKGFDPNKLKQTLLELRDRFGSQINTTASFLVGAPGDTPDTFEDMTISWLKGEGKHVFDGKLFFALNIHRESPYAVGSDLTRNFKDHGYREMTRGEIEYELAQDPKLTMEEILETERYNILWWTPHWNAMSAEHYAEKYRREVNWPNDFGIWHRAKVISAGLPSEEIARLRNPSNKQIYAEFEKLLPKVLNDYVTNKLSRNWFSLDKN
jgi:radical SAM superfamily enzyme YgiQ (UPF0313 family)